VTDCLPRTGGAISEARRLLAFQHALVGRYRFLDAPPPTGAAPAPPDSLPRESGDAMPDLFGALPDPSQDETLSPYERIEALIPEDSPLHGMTSLDEIAAWLKDTVLVPIDRDRINPVLGTGDPHAALMIVGEAPGADEDRVGRPFVGRAGQLLDRMLGAIGLGRDHAEAARAVYITNVLPWRPPANRTPTAEEVAIMLPFLRRHIALADPQVLVLMGNTPCGALLGRTGILRMRGKWTEAEGRQVLPMTHPAFLLRTPAAKREAWADLLEIQAKLRESA
jgi:DNA polymerase